MSNFPAALLNLYEEFHITRRGWRNKFHLAAETFGGNVIDRNGAAVTLAPGVRVERKA